MRGQLLRHARAADVLAPALSDEDALRRLRTRHDIMVISVADALPTTPGLGPVASIPVSVFCEKPPPGRKLRFCFAKDDATLEEAAAKLCQL